MISLLTNDLSNIHIFYRIEILNHKDPLQRFVKGSSPSYSFFSISTIFPINYTMYVGSLFLEGKFRKFSNCQLETFFYGQTSDNLAKNSFSSNFDLILKGEVSLHPSLDPLLVSSVIFVGRIILLYVHYNNDSTQKKGYSCREMNFLKTI